MPSLRLNPRAKSSRSAGVAIITTWEMPLYTMAIAVSVATKSLPSANAPAFQTVRFTLPEPPMRTLVARVLQQALLLLVKRFLS